MSSPPQSLLDYYSSVESGSNRRFDAQLSATAKQEKSKLDMQYKIAKMNASTEAERIEVDRWYKEQQIQLAEKAFSENIRQFDKEYGLKESDLTGFYGGTPTLARQKYESDLGIAQGQLTGTYQGAPTLQAQELARQFGLSEAGVTGTYQGQQTQAAKQFAQQLGLSEAGVTGTYQGQQTLEAQEMARRFGLDTQKFGLDVAKTAAEMRARPDMAYQFAAFKQSLPGLLAGQGGVPASQIQATPQGQTIPGTLAELGYLSAAMPGGAPATQSGADPTLQALGNVYQQGFDKLGGQTLEKMSEAGRGFMASAGSYLGYDPKEAVSKYLGSRLGQSVGG